MLRLTTLANKYKKRTIRPFYAQTQATPYAATLHADFQTGGSKIAGGQIAGTATTGLTGSQAAINPGAVMNLVATGEVVTLSGTPDADTNSVKQRPFGLCANFVGGQMDELGGQSMVGVWRGPGSVWEILAPVFDDTSLGTFDAAIDNTADHEVYMASSAAGVLVASQGGYVAPVPARLIQRLSANAIVVELLV